MPWHSKEQPTPFDTARIEGLTFLNGDVMAKKYHQEWVAGKKYPIIQFPSGLEREVLARTDDGGQETVHLFSELDLPRTSTRDELYDRIKASASDERYQIAKRAERVLTVFAPERQRGYHILCDPAARQIADIVAFPETTMDLMPGAIRAALPPLYHNEAIGLKASAPVKYFTPDTNWSWFPTEFDGDDLMFGLVSGFVVELGFFSLRELEGLRGPFGLPIERDRHFEPMTLEALQAKYQR